jgi:prolyl-tRNA synthetase
MPVIHPAETWQENGRWNQIGFDMGHLIDKNNRHMVLSMIHEEAVAELARKEIRSYRQLPQLIYHIQTKWRDNPRPRNGLIGAREFTMMDSYSLDASEENFYQQYRAHYQAYFKIFQQCGLPVSAVKSDAGIMGGQLAHEFVYLTSIGEDIILFCNHCGYAANRQVARTKKVPPLYESELEICKIPTPQTKSIEALAKLLDVPKSKTAKAVLMIATIPDGNLISERFIFSIVRGDMDVNETKLANAVHAINLRPATEDEIRAVGAVPGYASPIGLVNALVVVDDLIPQSKNLIGGANEDGYHFQNINFGRDYQAEIINDITLTHPGDGCLECGKILTSSRCIEVGMTSKLGTRNSSFINIEFLDRDGVSKPIIMGSYGIGIDRLLACIAEEHHDEHGLIWPITVAPYQVHLIVLPGKSKINAASNLEADSECIANKLYDDLKSAGIEVLYDDRKESPGVKFNDADLIGIPIRLTVSDRALQQGGIEIKQRDIQSKEIIPIDFAISHIEKLIFALKEKILENVVEVSPVW